MVKTVNTFWTTIAFTIQGLNATMQAEDYNKDNGEFKNYGIIIEYRIKFKRLVFCCEPFQPQLIQIIYNKN